jgi:hypothetical protein
LLSDEGHPPPQFPDLARGILQVMPALGEDRQAVASRQHPQRRLQRVPVQRAARGDRLDPADQPDYGASPPEPERVLRHQEDQPRLGRQRDDQQEAVDPVAVRRAGDDQRLARRHVLEPTHLDVEAEDALADEAHASGDEVGLQRREEFQRRPRRA